MAFTDLTQEEQQAIQGADIWLRGIVSTIVQLVKQSDYQFKKEYYTQIVTPALAQLNNNEKLPTKTGLATAQELTVAQTNGMATWVWDFFDNIQTLIDEPNTLALIVKAIGINSGS